MKAYLHFGTGNEPRQTLSCEARETYTPRKGQTTTGYGRAMPTRYQVKLHGRWRRVYCAQYGNAGSLYVGKPGAWVAVVQDIE